MTDEDRKAIVEIVSAAKAETLEAMRDMETRLLTEFQKWASPAEARARSHAAAIRTLDTEMDYISDRVTKPEGKTQ